MKIKVFLCYLIVQTLPIATYGTIPHGFASKPPQNSPTFSTKDELTKPNFPRVFPETIGQELHYRASIQKEAMRIEPAVWQFSDNTPPLTGWTRQPLRNIGEQLALTLKVTNVETASMTKKSILQVVRDDGHIFPLNTSITWGITWYNNVFFIWQTVSASPEKELHMLNCSQVTNSRILYTIPLLDRVMSAKQEIAKYRGTENIGKMKAACFDRIIKPEAYGKPGIKFKETQCFTASGLVLLKQSVNERETIKIELIQ